MVVQEDEAAIVRNIFIWYTQEHLSAGQITERLTKLRVPIIGRSRGGGLLWNARLDGCDGIRRSVKQIAIIGNTIVLACERSRG